jgi:methylated-DNA-[protein]-cysteine S-methyltransferase
MADRPGQSGQTADSAAIEPVRILLPSPLGALGIELVGERIGGVVIVPKGRERRLYKPFADLKRSERTDFIDEVLGRFSEYLAGARRKLELEYDLRATGVTGFNRRVLRQTARVPYGRTRTYQQIAEAAGRPDGYRQVLSTLMNNPLPLVVPCHRVVTHKSGIGSFIGGPKKKQWLLKMERRGLTVG